MIWTGTKLKFENSHGKTLVIVNAKTEEEAMEYIKKEGYVLAD